MSLSGVTCTRCDQPRFYVDKSQLRQANESHGVWLEPACRCVDACPYRDRPLTPAPFVGGVQ